MLEFPPVVLSCSRVPYPKATADGIASKVNELESLYSLWITVLIILTAFGSLSIEHQNNSERNGTKEYHMEIAFNCHDG